VSVIVSHIYNIQRNLKAFQPTLQSRLKHAPLQRESVASSSTASLAASHPLSDATTTVPEYFDLIFLVIY
jgi:hypothetical protein